MAVPSSGELELYGDIGTEIGVAQSNVTLHGMSQTAGFTPPDAMSEFYGYSSQNITINSADVRAFWPFSTSISPSIGGDTYQNFNNVASLQSTTKKWAGYSNALKIIHIAGDNSGLRLSTATNWTWSQPNMTAEGYFYINSSEPGPIGRVFGWGNRQDNICYSVDIYPDTTVNGRTNYTYGQLNASYLVPKDEWVWFVQSKSGSETKVFINGVLIYTGANGFFNNGYTSDGQYFHLACDYDSGYGPNPRYPGSSYWQDIVVYNASPFHNLNSLTVPTIPTSNRIV